jgi:hypothetical protein
MTSFIVSPRTLAALALLVIASTITLPAHAWEWPIGSRVTGSGNLTRVQRSVQGFKGVALEVPANVEIVQGEAQGVTIETDDNIAALIETVVEKDQLKIRLAQRRAGIKPTSLKITVHARTIESLAISGNGSFRAERLTSVSLAANISGSGDIWLRALDVDSLSLSISGSGDFTAGGRADTVRVNISGSGDVKTANLASRNVKLAISGSGDAKVWATEILTVSIAGVGDVGYYGDAALTQSVSGIGRINKLGTAPASGN